VERPSIYEFAGGRPAFRTLAAAHHQRCLADPVLEHPFSHPGNPDDAGLPDDAPFREALRAYMEWAVDEVLAYSPADSQVPDALPLLRWGWDGLERTAPSTDTERPRSGQPHGSPERRRTDPEP
jgi:hemoglobin